MSTELTYLTELEQCIHNPSAIQRVQLRRLRDVRAGSADIPDPSNPVVMLLEANATLGAATVNANELYNRRQYSVAAQNAEELYLHMSDKDYIDRFAQPARALISVVVAKQELLNLMALDPVKGYRKLVLPRNTYFTVADYTFSLSYPVEIRQLNHGGLQLVYDANVANPVQELTTNQIDHEVTSVQGLDMVFFQLECLQYSIESVADTIAPSKIPVIRKTIADQFFYVRVYAQQPDQSWNELNVTHSDQVFDPMVVTAVVRVIDKEVTVTVPQIYNTVFALGGRIRVDIYQTKGPVVVDLGGYSPEAYGATWLAINEAERNQYTAPLSKLSSVQVFSRAMVTGGRLGLDFEELRRRVVYNSTGPKNKPITPDQIQTSLIDAGYEIVKNIDVITNRVFLATRALPQPSAKQLITSASLSVQTAILNAQDILGVGTVIDNGNAVTITPDTIYQNQNGRLALVPKTEITAIQALVPDQQAMRVTQGNYYYSPFHYVLDLSSDEFAVRAYYLQNAQALTKTFISENDTTLHAIELDSYRIAASATGYRLEVATKSSESTKLIADEKLFVQLAFEPLGESDKAYLNGVFIGRTEDNERIFHFDLGTNFNVTAQDGLQLTQFTMYDATPRVVECPLNLRFDVLFSTSEQMNANWVPNEIDQALGLYLLPAHIAGIRHELLRIEFGLALKNLWTQSRSLVGTETYERYASDVYAVYERDVYELDPVTGKNFKIEAGAVVMLPKLHAVGDAVLDELGAPVLKYRKGEVKLDLYSKPVVLNPRRMYRQVDFTLVEGAYWFSTDTTATQYRQELAQILSAWITEDIERLAPSLLEKTRIYYYPKTTTGEIEVMFGPGLITSLNASQAFKLDLHVDENVYKSDDMRKQLTVKSIQVINDHLSRSVVSVSDIIVDLRAAYMGDVLDVRVSGLGGVSNFPIITVMNQTDRCSLRKRLVARPDGVLLVEEDITMNFVRHRIDKHDV